MQEYAQKPEKSSSDSNSRSSGQPPISEILQAYKNGTLQRLSVDEEKLLQAKTRDKSSERETLQQYLEYTHRDKSRYNSFIQGMFDTPQRKGVGNEEPLQGKFDSSSAASESTVQRGVKPNNTGLPDNLKSGIENLSGYSMDDVKVHYNSDKPAQLSALAYAQGPDIHVAPGQERHLPHEAWHVVQQKQGRVQPTMQMQGVDVNDNEGLEREADVMGKKSNSHDVIENGATQLISHGINLLVQRFVLPVGGHFNNRQDGQINNSNKWKLPAAAIPLQRAHIIPLQTIHEFASIIFKINKDNQNSWLNTSIKSLAKDNDSAFVQDSNGATINADAVNSRINSNATTADDFEFIERAISWMPGNIFIAPASGIRVNDPGNGFEIEAEKIVGSSKFKFLHNTYLAMRKVIEDPTSKIPDTICTNLKIIASWNGPYKFEMDNWVNDHGRYYAR